MMNWFNDTYTRLCGRARVARTVMWIGFVLTAGVLYGSIHNEGEIRERQLCGVVVSVHNNAKFRASTEHENLRSTKAYLADPESRHDSHALYRRIKENLPVVEARVAAADANVHATAPPPICKKYEHKENK